MHLSKNSGAASSERPGSYHRRATPATPPGPSHHRRLTSILLYPLALFSCTATPMAPIGPVPAPLVEVIGFEPTTYGLQSRRSPN